MLIREDPKSDEIIRPVLLGKNIGRYSYNWDNLWLINSHNGVKNQKIPRVDVENDYPAIYEYLLKFEDQLKLRQDKGDHWTNLRNCAYLTDFEENKIVWGNLSKESRFAFVKDRCFVNAPSPFFVTKNLYLLAILNSKIGEFYIKSLGMERSGGFIEFKPMFVEQMPIPIAKKDIQKSYSAVVQDILNTCEVGKSTEQIETQLNYMIFELFGLNSSEISYLLSK